MSSLMPSPGTHSELPSECVILWQHHLLASELSVTFSVFYLHVFRVQAKAYHLVVVHLFVGTLWVISTLLILLFEN